MSSTHQDPPFQFWLDYLNLPNCRTRSVEQDGNVLFVVAEYMPQCCPICGGRGLHCPGTEDWLIWDAPHLGLHPTLIQLFVPKIQCALCGDVEAKPEKLDYTRRILPKAEQGEEEEATEDELGKHGRWRPTRTERLIRYILDRVGTMTAFEQISRETLQSPGAVRTIFKYEFDQWDEKRGKDLPIDVSIDEAYYRRNYLGIVADASGDLGIIDVLPDEKQSTFIKRFFEAKNRDKVKTLSTDFRKDSRYAYTRPRKGKEAALPNAEVLGDRFHFSDKIGDGFDAVRKEVQRELLANLIAQEMAKFSDSDRLKFEEGALRAEAERKCAKSAKGRLKALVEKRSLLFARPSKLNRADPLIVEGLLKLHPRLREAYDLKNEGLQILDANTEREARRRFTKWQRKVEASQFKPHFQTALNIASKWKKELIAYIVHERRLHNARIEAAIFVLKTRNRMGRGLKFPMLRAVVLWESAERKRRRDAETHMTARMRIEKIEPYYDPE